MKLKYFIISIGICLSNLCAASVDTVAEHENALPAFTLNHQTLAKPSEITWSQWLELLEIERNKADCLGDFPAFKAYTKEVSATIGGKYGITLPTTPEEIVTLSYSVIRTRHKFRGANDIMQRFYAVSNTSDLPSNHRAYLAMVLSIDTITAAAMDNEDLIDKWSRVKADQVIDAQFVASIRASVKTWDKSDLTTTLEPDLEDCLQDARTIALSYEVFSIFAPKITLRTIYTEMIGGEYQGWTVHGADAFAYPIPAISIGIPGLQTLLRDAAMQSLARPNINMRSLSCCSVIATPMPETIARLALPPESVVLEYVHFAYLDRPSASTGQEPPKKRLFLTKPLNRALARIISKPFVRVTDATVDETERAVSSTLVAFDLRRGRINDEDLQSALRSGDTSVMCKYAFSLCNFRGSSGIARNIGQGLEMLRDAADLGCEEAKSTLPDAICNYATVLGGSENGVDILQAVELAREAKTLGNERARKLLPSLLDSGARIFFNGKDGISRDLLRALAYCKEAVTLGNRDVKEIIPTCLGLYIESLFDGKNGVVKDSSKAIELCRKMANVFGNEAKEAKRRLPIYLHNYRVWLCRDEQEAKRNIVKVIEALRESRDLGDAGAKDLLPAALSNYAVFLFNGDGIVRDVPKAIEVCREAADLGCVEAKNNLLLFVSKYGAWLLSGENGISKNIGEAALMLKEAADLGNTGAGDALELLKTQGSELDKILIRSSLAFSSFRFGRHQRVATGVFSGFIKLEDIIDEILR